MQFQREHYESWIRDFLKPRYPELVPDFKKALEDFETTITSGVLAPERLQTILECARNRRTPLGENVAALLGELAVRFASAQQVIREMSHDAKAHVRINALVALNTSSPTELHDEVLRPALKDRSSKLRRLAADKIMQFGLRHLIPDVEEAVAREADPRTRDCLARERDLLRKGFYSRRQDDGRIWLSCRLPGGSLTSVFVSAEDVRRKGLKAIAKELGAEV
jgi:hypothetical protein